MAKKLTVEQKADRHRKVVARQAATAARKKRAAAKKEEKRADKEKREAVRAEKKAKVAEKKAKAAEARAERAEKRALREQGGLGRVYRTPRTARRLGPKREPSAWNDRVKSEYSALKREYISRGGPKPSIAKAAKEASKGYVPKASKAYRSPPRIRIRRG
jgi:hypothetical protein